MLDRRLKHAHVQLVFLAHTAVTSPTTKLEAQIGASQPTTLRSKLSSAAGLWVDSLSVDQMAYNPAAARNLAPRAKQPDAIDAGMSHDARGCLV